jgi:hypothetical protein
MIHVVMGNQIWDLWINSLYTFEIVSKFMLYNDDGFFVNIRYNDHL